MTKTARRIVDHGLAVVVLLCAIMPTAPSLAQQDIESEELQQQRTTRQESARAARDAILKLEAATDLGPEITYADILENPDDIALNFRYAKQQLAKGGYRSAAATLERILLIQPDLPEVRLYYAVVLFRLDNPDEAEQQFLMVKDLPMPEALKTQVDAYLAEIKGRRETTHYVLQVSLGTQFDRNKNSAARTGRNLVLDIDSRLEDDDRRESDWAVTASTSLSMTHDLGLQDRHELIASVSAYDAEQMERDDLSARTFSLTGGLALHYPLVDVTPTVSFGKVGLSHERYETTWGGTLEVAGNLTKTLRARAQATYTDEKYYGITETTSAYLYTGYKWDFGPGISWVVSPAHKLDLELTHTVKRAIAYYYEYAGSSAKLGHTWLLGAGQFLLSSVEARSRIFREEDAAVSDRTRRDQRIRVKTTYGVSVPTLFQALGLPDDLAEVMQGFTWTNTASYLRQDSNIKNYDYENWTYQTLLSRRWEF